MRRALPGPAVLGFIAPRVFRFGGNGSSTGVGTSSGGPRGAPLGPGPEGTGGEPTHWPTHWPTIDLTEGRAQTGAPSGQFWPAEAPHGPPPGNGAPVAEAPHGPPGNGVPVERGPVERTPVSPVSLVASLQARSLGELIGGAIALGFPFVLAASLVSAFAHVPGEGVRGRLLAAFDYSSFLIAAALLVGMVCLLMLGRSTAGTGVPLVPKGQPFRAAIGLALGAESALVALGALVSFFVYLSLASGLPDAVAAHMLEELASLPVVAVALFWVWADGTLGLVFRPSSARNGGLEHPRAAGPPGPPKTDKPGAA